MKRKPTRKKAIAPAKKAKKAKSNLKLMRQFFIEYRPRIGQTLSDQLPSTQKLQTPSKKLAGDEISQYQLYLPSKELLKAKLLEWTREEEAKA